MEYFPKGPLSSHLTRYQGQVLEALKAFRFVVDAVAELHRANLVHRDIKPDNVFVAEDDRLVLGDCGLAIKLEDEERLTRTFENVGTRDYQPPWSYGMRLEDVKASFDIYSLAKLLWAMVSGRPRFPLWYFDEAPHDLRTQFPENPEVMFVHRILERCVVQRESNVRLADASALLEEVDIAIDASQKGAQLPTEARKMRCRFCGLGVYGKADNFHVSGNLANGLKLTHEYYVCDNCGHLETFVWSGDTRPGGWTE
jgi:serine/threonine protein kinase